MKKTQYVPHEFLMPLKGADVSETRRKARAAIRWELDHGLDDSTTPGQRRVMLAVLALAVGKGTAALSMRSVAKRLEIQAATLYSHFPGGKEQMLERTLRTNYIDFLHSILGHVDQLPDDVSAHDELRAVVAGQVDFQIDSPWENLFEILVAADRTGQFLSGEAQNNVARLRGLYIDYVEAITYEIGRQPAARARAWAIINFLNDARTFSDLMQPTPDRPELLEEAYRCSLAIAGAPS